MEWAQELVDKIKKNTLTQRNVKALSKRKLKTPIWDEAPLLHVVSYLGTAQMMHWVIEALGDNALSQAQLAATMSDTQENRQLIRWTPLDYASRAQNGDIQEGRQKVIALLKVLGDKASGMIARPCDLREINGNQTFEGLTPLHLVARYQDSVAVSAILTALGSEASKVYTMPNKNGWTPLHLVARYQDSAAVSVMLTALGSEASKVSAMPDNKGWTPLHQVACKQDSAAVSAILTALGPEASKVCAMPDNKGWTPLHQVACQQDSVAVSAILTALGSEASKVCTMPNKNGWTPLHFVARYQDSVAVSAILTALGSEASKVCTMPNKNGWTPLHLVARYQDSAAVSVMLTALGSEASKVSAMPDNKGWTPLHQVACKQDSAAVSAILTALGPEASKVCAMPDNNGVTPLHQVACQQDSVAVSAILTALGSEASKVSAMPDNEGWTPLHFVARNESGKLDASALTAMLTALGSEASKVSAMPNKNSMTPLHFVALYQDSAAVSAMLTVLGAEAAKVCAMPEKEGWTPLHIVARNESGKLDASALKAMLWALGPDAKRALALKTSNGDTSLCLSKKSDKSSGMEAVLANPEPYLRSTSTWPQLDVSSYAQMAVKIGNVESLIWLQTQHGLKATTIRDDQNNTLLHIAAADGHGAAVKWLLNAGLDSKAKNGAFKTAQEVAKGEALAVLTEAKRQREEEARRAHEAQVQRLTLEQEKLRRSVEQKKLQEENAKLQEQLKINQGKEVSSPKVISSSHKPLPTSKKKSSIGKRLPGVPKPKPVVRCKALYDYTAEVETDELSVKAGTLLTVLKKHDSGWWLCRDAGREGLVPSTYVEESQNDSITKPIAQPKPAIVSETMLSRRGSSQRYSRGRGQPIRGRGKQRAKKGPGIGRGRGSRIDERGHMRINLLIPYEELAFAKKLGQGGFGTVHAGTLQDHTQVAIKKLFLDRLTERAEEEFKNEAAIMAQLRHPNVVALYGIVLQPEYCMVMELLENGSLYSVLHSKRELDWALRQRIALDMSRGLAFLHSKKILHRDLKSLNVLLDGNMRAKLADFGLSLVRAETKSKTKQNESAGTLQWMAPELLSGEKMRYDASCDIYSLAVTLWELVSRKLPFEEAPNPSLIPLWIAQGKREVIPTDCPKLLGQLIQRTWSEDPAKRLDAAVIVKVLQSIVSKRATLTTTQSFDAELAYRENTEAGAYHSGYHSNTSSHYSQSTPSGYRGNVSTLPSQGSYRPNTEGSMKTGTSYQFNS